MNLSKLSSALGALFLLPSCLSGGKIEGPCMEDLQCAPRNICVESVCQRSCISHLECEAGTSCQILEERSPLLGYCSPEIDASSSNASSTSPPSDSSQTPLGAGGAWSLPEMTPELYDYSDMIKNCGDPLLIDNSEDLRRTLCNAYDRNGEWYWYSDPADEMNVNPQPGSHWTWYYFEDSEGPYLGYSGQATSPELLKIQVAFDDRTENWTPFDVSPYAGLSFRHRSGAGHRLRMGVITTQIAYDGKKPEDCVQGCYAATPDPVPESFGVVLDEAPLEWTEFKVCFDDMKLEGSQAEVDLTQVVGIDIGLVGDAGAFHIGVDDLAFLPGNDPDCR